MEPEVLSDSRPYAWSSCDVLEVCALSATHILISTHAWKFLPAWNGSGLAEISSYHKVRRAILKPDIFSAHP